MKKIYTPIKPVGFLYSEGRKFFLLREYAIFENVMMSYPVAEFTTGELVADPTDPINKTKTGYDLLTLKVHPTNCAIALGYYRDPILVFEGQYEQEEPADLPKGDLWVMGANPIKEEPEDDDDEEWWSSDDPFGERGFAEGETNDD